MKRSITRPLKCSLNIKDVDSLQNIGKSLPSYHNNNLLNTLNNQNNINKPILNQKDFRYGFHNNAFLKSNDNDTVNINNNTDKNDIKSIFPGKILIANRGEIACRIIKTCKRLGIPTVAIFTESDRNSKYVNLADESVLLNTNLYEKAYLDVDQIVSIARKLKCWAVHPGYGFLSENNGFVDKLNSIGCSFIGPNSNSILNMGDKAKSKHLANKAKVNNIPGSNEIIIGIEDGMKKANEIGFPIMVKAIAGGGGKGMRISWNNKDLEHTIKLCKSEAESSFGDGRLLIEKYIENPRHIEIQIIGDKFGNMYYLPERDCSIQRRNQKVIEESPAPFMDVDLRRRMGEQAISLAKEVGYYSVGTCEFLLNPDTKEFYFLEMNTRLQVEHPITEYVTGLDLVELMIRIANNEKLELDQNKLSIPIGYAIEARVYAEDSFNCIPLAGKLKVYEEPNQVAYPNYYLNHNSKDTNQLRIDSGVIEGSEIPIQYDPLISKVISFSNQSRTEAIKELSSGLGKYIIQGVQTNISLIMSILSDLEFNIGENISTNYLERRGFIEKNKDNQNNKLKSFNEFIINQNHNLNRNLLCYKNEDGMFLNIYGIIGILKSSNFDKEIDVYNKEDVNLFYFAKEYENEIIKYINSDYNKINVNNIGNIPLITIPDNLNDNSNQYLELQNILITESQLNQLYIDRLSITLSSILLYVINKLDNGNLRNSFLKFFSLNNNNSNSMNNKDSSIKENFNDLLINNYIKYINDQIISDNIINRDYYHSFISKNILNIKDNNEDILRINEKLKKAKISLKESINNKSNIPRKEIFDLSKNDILLSSKFKFDNSNNVQSFINARSLDTLNKFNNDINNDTYHLPLTPINKSLIIFNEMKFEYLNSKIIINCSLNINDKNNLYSNPINNFNKNNIGDNWININFNSIYDFDKNCLSIKLLNINDKNGNRNLSNNSINYNHVLIEKSDLYKSLSWKGINIIEKGISYFFQIYDNNDGLSELDNLNDLSLSNYKEINSKIIINDNINHNNDTNHYDLPIIKSNVLPLETQARLNKSNELLSTNNLLMTILCNHIFKLILNRELIQFKDFNPLNNNLAINDKIYQSLYRDIIEGDKMIEIIRNSKIKKINEQQIQNLNNQQQQEVEVEEEDDDIIIMRSPMQSTVANVNVFKNQIIVFGVQDKDINNNIEENKLYLEEFSIDAIILEAMKMQTSIKIDLSTKILEFKKLKKQSKLDNNNFIDNDNVEVDDEMINDQDKYELKKEINELFNLSNDNNNNININDMLKEIKEISCNVYSPYLEILPNWNNNNNNNNISNKDFSKLYSSLLYWITNESLLLNSKDLNMKFILNFITKFNNYNDLNDLNNHSNHFDYNEILLIKLIKGVVSSILLKSKIIHNDNHLNYKNNNLLLNYLILNGLNLSNSNINDQLFINTFKSINLSNNYGNLLFNNNHNNLNHHHHYKINNKLTLIDFDISSSINKNLIIQSHVKTNDNDNNGEINNNDDKIYDLIGKLFNKNINNSSISTSSNLLELNQDKDKDKDINKHNHVCIEIKSVFINEGSVVTKNDPLLSYKIKYI